MKHFPFIALSVALYIWISDPFLNAIILAIGVGFALYHARSDANISSLCILILSLILAERFAFYWIPVDNPNGPTVWVNNTIFIVHLLFDVVGKYLVALRAPLLNGYLRRHHVASDSFHFTKADLAMFSLMRVYIWIDILALIENLLRNMEHLGVPETYAQYFWEWNWLFYSYAEIKYILFGMQFLIIWSTVTNTMRQQSQQNLI
ncbi:hypothetical protein KIH87_16085 [Paraneptunicella aestuarii]|uniref:hypothetical protein n=1 Tax=Paraneptunicella aestuarii TaxID=2831148 RepID=UPI001E3EDA91|nr:hypothetical protein [Paraneptunicella aestuarii]UAA38192.1 hypothetical protein KIH87_16085 [Paraneptunicella aestuarii]